MEGGSRFVDFILKCFLFYIFVRFFSVLVYFISFFKREGFGFWCFWVVNVNDIVWNLLVGLMWLNNISSC